MKPCKCGLLRRYANDPAVPIGLDPSKEEYFIEAVPGTHFKLSCCFFCGGDFGSEPLEPCKCNQLAEWAATENSVIKYDQSVSEYYIEYDSTRLPFYYCPFCRGVLPESRRDRLFVEPSPDEISDIRQKLSGMTSIAQVISAVGAPDERKQRTAEDAKDEVMYNVLPIKETLLYKSVLRTGYLCVQETVDGRIIVSVLKRERNDVAPMAEAPQS
jgi:hypothetical protein